MNQLIELRNTQQERNFWKEKYLRSESIQLIDELIKKLDQKDREIQTLQRRVYKLELQLMTKMWVKPL